MSHDQRVPAGSPEGGQFAAGSNAEPDDLSLTDDSYAAMSLEDLTAQRYALKDRVNYLRDRARNGEVDLTPRWRHDYHELYDEYRTLAMVEHERHEAAKTPQQRAADEAKRDSKPPWQAPDYRPRPFDSTLTDDERRVWGRVLEGEAVYVDLETTTTDPLTGHIIEAAFVKPDGERFHRFFGVPTSHERWNGTGMQEIHHISPDDVRDQPVLADSPEAQREIADFVGSNVVVAHNARFERSWLTSIGVDTECADTKKMFGALSECEGADPTSESTTMEAFTARAGVPYEDAHRAISDALMTRQAVESLRPEIERTCANHSVWPLPVW